jgi:hypothetical protein
MRNPAFEIVGKVMLRSLDAVLHSRLAQDAVSMTLRSPLVDAVARDVVRYRVIQRVAEPVAGDPELERAVATALDSPAARRIVDHVIEGAIVDEAVARLLESEELWILVDEVARSPAVTDAIGHQGAGLADQVAEVVRDRSRTADARLERAARRVLRRKVEPAS